MCCNDPGYIDALGKIRYVLYFVLNKEGEKERMNTRVIITLDDVEKMQYDPESIGIAVLQGLGFIVKRRCYPVIFQCWMIVVRSLHM